ncbi:YdjY domain-containing protein [Clostridium sp. JNZ X4-2]
MKRILSIIFSVLFIGVLSVGCSTDKQSSNTQKQSAENKDQKVLTVNKNNKEVKILSEVNGKYFTENTRHGVVFKDGSNGEKSVLRGLVDPEDFYNALISIGAKPGNNLQASDKGKGKKVEGSKLNVFVTWDGLGKEIPFSDIIDSSDPRPMDIRFGGNLAHAKKMKTGCILCLDSCAVGITSNSAYAFGESDTVKFHGKKDVLPKDGTKVTVIFRLAE